MLIFNIIAITRKHRVGKDWGSVGGRERHFGIPLFAVAVFKTDSYGG